MYQFFFLLSSNEEALKGSRTQLVAYEIKENAHKFVQKMWHMDIYTDWDESWGEKNVHC